LWLGWAIICFVGIAFDEQPIGMGKNGNIAKIIRLIYIKL